MQPNLTSLSQEEQASVSELLELFYCADIPLHTNTQNFSGGEKLRVSLVRAFHLGQVVIVNSSLLSLDQQMRVEVQERIRRLVANSSRHFTVFIREN
jgi:ABC-type multidrug transport system ATPase subunit